MQENEKHSDAKSQVTLPSSESNINNNNNRSNMDVDSLQFQDLAVDVIVASNNLNCNNSFASNVNNNSNNNSSGSVDSERRYRPQKYCAVCGDKAIACNFNAVTCESCKAFFRRNAFKEQRLKCLFENRCIIDRVTRRFCSKCRLLKCFQIGMKREWILTDEQKQIKRVKIMQNKQSRQQVGSSSPSHSDDSSPQQAIASSLDTTTNKSSNLERASNSRSRVDRSKQTRVSKLSKQTAGRNKNREVQTRDAFTSCPDELELLNPNNRLIHYCSLASHCQYCSLRLMNQPEVDHQHLLNQQHHQQQQQLSSMQMQMPYNHSNTAPHLAINYTDHELSPHNSVPDGLQMQAQVVDTASTNCCCLTTSNQQQQQQQAIQFNQSQSVQQISSNMNAPVNQPVPQLHVMTSSESISNHLDSGVVLF